MSDKTCENCNHRPGSCMDRDVFSDENGDCQSWQPASVTTTDVKSNVPWHHMGEPNGMYNPDGSIRTWTSDVEWYREAIAKRDDLIRRFLQHDDNVKTLTYGEWRQEERVLLADANELLGV